MNREPFPRALRLRKSGDFRRVQRIGKKVVSQDFIVLFHPNPDGGLRFGLAVSRKVGNAVARNRVKRWFREAIRRERGPLSGVDVVFIARHSAAESDFARIRQQVVGALQRLGRMHRTART